MKRSEEIQNLIDKVVFNELVDTVKKGTPVSELKDNEAYVEAPYLYGKIKNMVEGKDKEKAKIEQQVNINKKYIKEKLFYNEEQEMDNIIVLRALKLMDEKQLKALPQISSAIIKLDHTLYIAEVQESIERFGTGEFSEEEKIRKHNEKVYDSIKTMRQRGYKNVLDKTIENAASKQIKYLREELEEIGDKNNCDKIDSIAQEGNIIEYKELINSLKDEYKPQDKKYTNTDKYVIQFAEELNGKDYGDRAISYEGSRNALAIRRQGLFEKIKTKLKNIFSRRNRVDSISKNEKENYEVESNKKQRKNISPKVEIDSSVVNNLNKAPEENKDIELEQN